MEANNPSNNGSCWYEDDRDQWSDTFHQICQRTDDDTSYKGSEIDAWLKVSNVLSRVVEDLFLVLKDSGQPE